MSPAKPISLKSPLLRAVVALPLAAGLAGCVTLGPTTMASHSSRDCMARAMYFESIRSSDDGMLAVGTVVMNRVADPKHPNSVCGVVGQKNQFASGVLTRPMTEQASKARAMRVADSVLRGARHSGVRRAMHFHTSGLSFPYRNMHYVLEAGGNAFYERR